MIRSDLAVPNSSSHPYSTKKYTFQFKESMILTPSPYRLADETTCLIPQHPNTLV